jgi:glycosyltransferase involved in cell wall biosynthesis
LFHHVTETNTTVSIITPCFNGGKYLRQTIESVLAQSQPSLEMIVIDDGSTDDSAAIAESFGPPVRVIRQPNQGESIARNRGIGEARGTHLLFLDADDLLHADALSTLLAAVDRRVDCVARMGCALFCEDPNQPLEQSWATAPAFFPAIISGNLGPPHTWLVPTAIVRRIGGFRTDLQIFEDWEFWCRIGLTGAAIENVDLIGAYYRRHPNSQLAQMRTELTALGHVRVLEALVAGILPNDQMVEAHGENLFWQLWVAINRARSVGVPWKELTKLSTALAAVANRGPLSVKKSRYAQMIRWLGVRGSESLRTLLSRRATKPALHS